MKNIFVSDYTLKKMAEDRTTALLFREKTALASSIDAYGADAVELPAMKSVREDTVINKTIALVVKNAILAIPVVGAGTVADAYKSIEAAAKPRLQVELPVSTVQMEYIHHVKDDGMMTKIEGYITEAKALCADVEFIAQDAARADREFLIKACKRAEELGATEITIADTAGVSMPDDIAELTAAVREAVSVKLYVEVSDALHMAPALAVRAIAAGADGIKCAAAGKAVLMTGDLADIIDVKGDTIGVSANLDSTGIHRNIKAMMDKVSPDHAAAEAQAGESEVVFLDADSTLAKVGEAAEKLGYDLSAEDLGKVHQAMRGVAEKKGMIGAKELEALIASYAMQAPSTYHLEEFTANSTNITSSMAHIVLKKEDEKFDGVAIGDGPIDAAFRAIEQIVGYHYELDDFQIQAVTEGKEALGSALVRLRSEGRLYSGNGLSTDIVGASIRAYVNALNKIVFEETK